MASQVRIGCRRQRGLDLTQDGQPFLMDRGNGTLLKEFLAAQCGDGAVHRLGERHGVQITQHESIFTATANQAGAAGEIDAESFRRLRDLFDGQSPSPRAQLQARPIDLGRGEIAGIELMHQQHENVLLFHRPRLRGRCRGWERHCLAVALQLAGAQVGLVQLDPFGRDPALVLEHPELRVGAMEVNEPDEKQRQNRFPARVGSGRQRPFQRRLINEHERLSQLPEGLPDAVGELWRSFGVFHVLLDQLAPVGTQSGIDELDGAHAVQVHAQLAVAHGIERADHVLLPADHVERRQFPQPRCRALRALQRICGIGLRSKEAVHCFHR